MFYREPLHLDLNGLDTLVKEREETVEAVRVAPDEIEFHLSATDPVIKVGDRETIPSETSLQAFGDLLQIPSAFMKRAQSKVQTRTMDALLTDMLRNTLLKDARVAMTGDYVHGITEWGREEFTPAHLTKVALNVLDPESEVTRLVDTPGFFGFDVRVPESASVGVVENGEAYDPRVESKVGDVTTGGIRLGVNIKQGLAPTVEEYLYRLVCTNGMTTMDAGLKVDARGQTVDEVMAELEQMAEIAFGRVEKTIQHFYDLRNQRVDNVERALRAIARERGIPDRSSVALMDLAAGEDMPDDPTMFDVVNLITNFANSPSINRDGGRIILEGAGGAVVTDHAARCSHCQQKVTH